MLCDTWLVVCPEFRSVELEVIIPMRHVWRDFFELVYSQK